MDVRNNDNIMNEKENYQMMRSFLNNYHRKPLQEIKHSSPQLTNRIF